MNAQTKITEAEPVTDSTAIVAVVMGNPTLALLDSQKFDAFYDAVKREVGAHVPDLTTAKGRDAIKSLAFKVTKSKTALDDAGKKLTEEARSQITKVDAARRNIREKLDALRDEVRQPLTEWEAAEEQRQADVQAAMADLQGAAVISINDTSATLRARLAKAQAVQITDEHFQEWAAAARSHQSAAVEALEAGIDRLAKEEADKAELQRLRDEATRREQEEVARLAREAAERDAAERRAREEAEAAARAEAAAERQRVEAERAEQARKDAEQRAAAEAAAAEARREADAARAETERLQREQRAREEAAAAAERQRQAEEAAAAAREANKAHRARIMTAAKKGLIDLQIDEETAKRIVLAIVAEAVPHVSIRF